MSCRRSLGSYYPIKESKSFTEKNWGISQSYFPVQEQVLSYSGDIEYIDEVIDDDEMMEYMKDESQLKGRRGVLRITGEDKRPKCQPIGAQIDCRFGVKVGKLKIELNNIFFRCGPSLNLPAGGWCALWKCGGIQEVDTIGRWECASWC